MGHLAETQESADRKLGDEWRDWDGRASQDCSAGKRLFFGLSGGVLLILSALALLAWYLVAPRLAEWHGRLPVLALVVAALAVAGLTLSLLTTALSLLLELSLPRWLCASARGVLVRLEGCVFRLGALLSISRDRIAHSFVRINNALSRTSVRPAPASTILLLLPRCLSKEQIRDATSLAESYGVGVAVVAGGELARQRIRERRPRVVIGVACERDLLSGIRDVRGKLSVLGIPNTRPHGPCKNTLVDLHELRRAIELYLGSGRRAPSSSAVP